MTRITIAGAVGAALHIGKGDPDKVDQTALDFSRAILNQNEVNGEVICCEGPKTTHQHSVIRKSRHQQRSISGIYN
jgi:fructose-1,6-bisphosphatase/sedoheptulose 1,7-bisphosphatase-like protein